MRPSPSAISLKIWYFYCAKSTLSLQPEFQPSPRVANSRERRLKASSSFACGAVDHRFPLLKAVLSPFPTADCNLAGLFRIPQKTVNITGEGEQGSLSSGFPPPMSGKIHCKSLTNSFSGKHWAFMSSSDETTRKTGRDFDWLIVETFTYLCVIVRN